MTYVGRLWSKGERVSVWGHHIVPNGTRGVIFEVLPPTSAEPPDDYEPEYQVLIPGHYQDREEPMAWVMEQKRVREQARGSGSEVHWPLESRYIFEAEFAPPEPGPEESNVVRLQTGATVAGLPVVPEGAVMVSGDLVLLDVKRLIDQLTLAMYFIGGAQTSEDFKLAVELIESILSVAPNTLVEVRNRLLERGHHAT